MLDVRDLEGIRLVRMRNPWGHYSWSGDWSDNSPIWTPELRDMLLSGGGDDGVFWIAFQDVLLYFDCIDICKVRLGWSEVRLSGTLPPFSSKPHQSATLLTVLEPTEVEFSLFQEGQRNSEKAARCQLDLCVVIFRTSSSGAPQIGKLVQHSKRQVLLVISIIGIIFSASKSSIRRFVITEKAPTSCPSLMIIASRTQFHVERPLGQRPFSIVS